MKTIEAINIAQQMLPEKRMQHVLGVVQTAQHLAQKYGVDVEKAGVAAALHDIAKYYRTGSLRKLLETSEFSSYLEANEAIWHAPVGAILAKEKYGVTDEDILNAIQFHTTGRENMSELEKIIFVADFIEPTRTLDVASECRKIADINLNSAVAFECKCTINFLQSNNENIHEDTIKTFEYYKGDLI